MQNIGFLIAAYAIVWVALFGYVVSLGSRQKNLEKEVRALDSALKKDE